MTWKGFFEGIESLADTLLFTPLNAIREFELTNWWGANFMTWVFIGIFFAAFYYWMKQLANSMPMEKRTAVKPHIPIWEAHKVFLLARPRTKGQTQCPFDNTSYQTRDYSKFGKIFLWLP